MANTLKLAENFVVPTDEDQNIFSANSALKKAPPVVGVCGCCDKEIANFTRSVHFLFIFKVSFNRILRCPQLLSVSSPLVFDVSNTPCRLCDGPWFSVCNTSLNFTNVWCTMYEKNETAKLHLEVNYSLFSREVNNLVFSSWPTERHKGTIWCLEARIILAVGSVTKWFKREKSGNTWSHWGMILINSSFELKLFDHQTPAPTTPDIDSKCGHYQRHQAGTPQPTVPGSW